MGARHPNSDSPVCTVGTLSTDPSFQLPRHFLKNSNNLHSSDTYAVSPYKNEDGFTTNGFFFSNLLLASVCSDLSLHYRSVVLKLVRVAEHPEVMGLFAEHHEILICLIPLYEPGRILLAKKNMTVLMCAI